MLNDDDYLAKKMKHNSKNQIRDPELLLQTPEHKKSNKADGMNFENIDSNEIQEEDYDPRNPKILEFKIYDQVNIDSYKEDNFDDEEENAKKFENKGKLRQLANQKKGIVEFAPSRPPLITPKSSQEIDLQRRSTMNRQSIKGTMSESQFVREINRSLQTSEQNFKEFKLNESPSKLDNYEFSEVSSVKMASPTNKEKEILGNFTKITTMKVEKGKALKIMNQNLELKKK